MKEEDDGLGDAPPKAELTDEEADMGSGLLGMGRTPISEGSNQYRAVAL